MRRSIDFCFAYRPLLASCLALSGLLACNTGQIGGEVGADPNEGGDLGESGSCAILERVPVDESSNELAAELPALLEGVSGAHETSLAWGPRPLGDLQLTPDAGSSTIALHIAPDAESAQIERRAPVQGNGQEGGAFPGGDAACPDRLTFDADVTVTTANGAFDDTFRASFAATSPLLATSRVALELDELEGTFRVTGGDVSAWLVITVADGTVSGSVDGVWEIRGDDAVSQSGLVFGRFPEEGCVVGHPIDGSGELAERSIDALHSLRDFDLTWRGGAQTTLSLEHTVEAVCLDDSYSGEGPSVVLEVLTTARTADDGIDGTWALEARVGLDEGDLEDIQPSSIDLIRQAYLADTYPGADFAATTGIKTVPVDHAPRATFSFSVRDDLDDAHPPAGELTVMGVTESDCSEQPPETDADGGASAPGCDGSQYEEVGGATLVGMPGEP